MPNGLSLSWDWFDHTYHCGQLHVVKNTRHVIGYVTNFRLEAKFYVLSLELPKA